MSRNGSGVYSLPTGQPVVTGTTISSTTFNTLTTDLANALTTSVASDGQTAMTANLPLGGFKATSMAAATVAGDAARFEQIGALALAQGAASSGTPGLRNRVMNGIFNINQRAVSGTVTLAAGAYGHDRFKAGAGGCTYTFSASANGNILTISAGTLQQVIEGTNLEGGSFILSWSGTATGRVDSGSYGASGVIGTAVAGTNQTVEFGTGTLSKVQYEIGSIATTFEQRPLGLETVLCQRYFERLGGLGRLNLCMMAAYTTTSGFAVFVWQTRKRALPTITLNSPSLYRLLGMSQGSTCTLSDPDANLTSCNITVTGTGYTTGGSALVQALDSQFPTIDISAEL